MKRGHERVCLWKVAVTLSFLLSGHFVPTLDAQVVSGCLTKRGTIKRIDRPCKKNQEAVALPLAETADQLREGIAELAGRNHEIPFHATIHPGEVAYVTNRLGIGLMAQVIEVVNAVRRTDENAAEPALVEGYQVRLKLVNMADTPIVYAGSGGMLEPQQEVELADWLVTDALTVGHPEKDLVTAYNPYTRAHVQLDVSKMMLIADPNEDAVVVVGAVRVIDPETFAVESRPIAVK